MLHNQKRLEYCPKRYQTFKIANSNPMSYERDKPLNGMDARL